MFENIAEEVMDNTVPESSINNISQKDEESSDEIEDDYCINESSDEEATSLTMYKSCNGTVRCKSSSNSLQGCRSTENIVHVQVGATKFILNHADTSTDVFKELLGKNCLLSIYKYTVTQTRQ